jgi:hypothetical protein
MLMSLPEVQRKCVAGVRTTAHGPDQNNVEPVEHVGSREQIGAGLSQPGTAARDPIKTLSAPASPSSRQLIRPRAQAARRDRAYRISHDDARIHMIADMLACPKSATNGLMTAVDGIVIRSLRRRGRPKMAVQRIGPT